MLSDKLNVDVAGVPPKLNHVVLPGDKYSNHYVCPAGATQHNATVQQPGSRVPQSSSPLWPQQNCWPSAAVWQRFTEENDKIDISSSIRLFCEH